MNDEQYLKHCLQTMDAFASELSVRTEHLPVDDTLRQLAQSFTELGAGSGDIYNEGAALVSRLFTTYPDFAPTFPRELLWFLGGDCLHYMPDDEIALFQQIEQIRLAAAERGATADLREARSRLLTLQQEK